MVVYLGEDGERYENGQNILYKILRNYLNIIFKEWIMTEVLYFESFWVWIRWFHFNHWGNHSCHKNSISYIYLPLSYWLGINFVSISVMISKAETESNSSLCSKRKKYRSIKINYGLSRCLLPMSITWIHFLGPAWLTEKISFEIVLWTPLVCNGTWIPSPCMK